MLDFDYHLPEEPGGRPPLIVLLHGRGSHKGDLMGLRPYLPAHAVVVAPQAPFSGAALGYGQGWAWYRFLGGTKPEPETFVESQTRLREFLQALPGELGITPGPLVLGGFSQGATMSTAYSLRHPGEVPFVLHFSGFLADHPSVQVAPGSVKGTAYFWGHGTSDTMVPWELARQGREQLLQAGADLTARDYPIGHWIDPQELQDAVDWLEQGLQARFPEG